MAIECGANVQLHEHLTEHAQPSTTLGLVSSKTIVNSYYMNNKLKMFFILASTMVLGTSASFVDGGHCSLASVLPFSFRRNSFFQSAYFPGAITLDEGIAGSLFGNIAAALMAIDHVNNRNGTIVHNFSSDSFRECDLSIDQFLAIDSLADDLKLRLRNILQGSDEDIPRYLQSKYADADMQIQSRKINHTSTCAVIGPFRSRVAEEIVEITNNLNIPLISPLAASVELNDNDLFGRMTVETTARSKVLVKYFDMIGRDYIAILSSDDRVGAEFSKQMELSCEAFGRTCKSFKFRRANGDGYQSLHLALQHLQESGFTTIVCSLDMNLEMDYLAKYATEVGLQGESFMWIIHCTESFLPITNFIRAGHDSPVHEFLKGLGYFTVGVPKASSEAFERSFKGNDEYFFQRVLKAIPSTERDKYRTLVKADYFQHIDQFGATIDSAFVFDSVAAMALGACELRTKPRDGNDYNNDNVRYDLMDKIFSTSFVGASGNVTFDRSRRARDVGSVEYTITNVRPRNVVGRDSGESFYRYDIVPTSKYSVGAWSNKAEFIYADGSASAPLPLRLVDTMIVYVSQGLRVGTLFFSSIGLLACFVAAAMVWVHQKKDEIRISQPRFLYTIILTCVISFLVVLLILVDTRTPYLNKILDELCVLKMYMYYLALIVRYTALMIKLRMLNIALSSSREPIFSVFLLGPLILIPAFSIASLTVSVVAHTPRATEKVVLWDEYGFPTVMYHYCQFNNERRNDINNTPAVQVAILMHVMCLIMLFRMSWSAKNENIPFNEARGIFYSICVETATVIFSISLAEFIKYCSDRLDIEVVDLIFSAYIFPLSIVSTGSLIFIVLPKFRSPERSLLPVPEIVGAESRFISNAPVLVPELMGTVSRFISNVSSLTNKSVLSFDGHQNSTCSEVEGEQKTDGNEKCADWHHNGRLPEAELGIPVDQMLHHFDVTSSTSRNKVDRK